MHDSTGHAIYSEMRLVESLIDALVACIPALDSAPLRVELPASIGQLAMLRWMADHLERQGLLAYEEWKEYMGHVPELNQLSGIDCSTFDPDFITGLLFDVDWDQVDARVFHTLPYELPYLEYRNAFLVEHSLRLVDLLPFENAYMFVVKDDSKLLEQLIRSLQPFDMGVNLREPLDQQGVEAYLGGLLRGGA